VLFDPAAARERLRQWRVLNEWKRRFGDLPLSAGDLVRWHSGASELSRRHSSGWQEVGIDVDKVARIQRMREAFARLRGSGFAP